MILLHTSDSSGTIFVRTDQLDGETDWKVRESVKYTQEIGSERLDNILRMSWNVLVEAPSDLIYSFKGVFSADPSIKESLKTCNTLWANMKIASGEVLGIVIYTGKETRIELNNREVEMKYGKTDEEVNTMTKYLFTILAIISLLVLILSGKIIQSDGLIFYMRIFILFSSIIPISLKVNIDFAKLYYSLVINQDKHIKGAVTRNSNIPEELGRIEYLLSDKTGTLTKNIMIFKKLRSMITNFEEEQFDEMKNMLKSHW
jgi:phospholipid-translocating ATPase